MGACVLCGKSAGLFHSLHKNCYQQYQAHTKRLVENLTVDLTTLPAEQLADKIHQQVESLPFVTEARARTLVRVLELFAEQHLQSRQDMQQYADSWPAILSSLQPDKDLFIDSAFLARQQNIAALTALSHGVLPACNATQNATLMSKNETLWWHFDEAGISPLTAPTKQKKWSVANQLMDNLVKKQQQPALNVHQEKGWMLSVTNQRLLFISNAQDQSIHYRDIYSATPIEGGVQVQCKQQRAMPQFISCEDERLLYLLIRHARNQGRPGKS